MPEQDTPEQDTPDSEIARRQPAPQSVTRVIRILELLCASPAPLTLADLARQLDCPKSSLSALLRGLAEEQFVVPGEGAWRLGPGAFGLGSALLEARRGLSSSDLIRQGMRHLAQSTGETVLLAVRDGGSGRDGADRRDTITYVDVIESRNTVRFAVSVGDRRPLFATSAGRALLAAAADSDVADYLARLKPERLTPHSETGKPTLAAAIAEARRAGFAQTIDQAADGVTGTAAVIRDASGALLGALVTAAPTSRSADRREELARQVRDAAAAISRSLGWRG